LLLHESWNNIVYANAFIDNYVGYTIYQAEIDGGGGNSFNLPAPWGGNYWSNFDEPSEGCYDSSPADGFCDAPKTFPGGADNLPLTADPTPSGYKPVLNLSAPTAYWSSLRDYEAGNLSVDWTINNDGGECAYGFELTSVVNSGRVTVNTLLPVSGGDIPSCESSTITLSYHVSTGTSSFVSALQGRALNGSGQRYTYP